MVLLYPLSLTSKLPFLQPSLKLMSELPSGAAPIGLAGKLLLRLEIAAQYTKIIYLYPPNRKRYVKHPVITASLLVCFARAVPKPWPWQSITATIHGAKPCAALCSCSNTRFTTTELGNSCENSFQQTIHTCSLKNQEKSASKPFRCFSLNLRLTRKQKEERNSTLTSLLTYIHLAYYVH